MIEIKHENHKFEIFMNNEKAGEMLYNHIDANTINIYHTEVSEEFSGHGLGKKLVESAVNLVKENNLKIAATCPYANAVLSKDESATNIFVN